MLDEEEYLRFSPDYTDWNEEAGSPDELVLDYITLKKRSDQLEYPVHNSFPGCYFFAHQHSERYGSIEMSA